MIITKYVLQKLGFCKSKYERDIELIKKQEKTKVTFNDLYETIKNISGQMANMSRYSLEIEEKLDDGIKEYKTRIDSEIKGMANIREIYTIKLDDLLQNAKESAIEEKVKISSKINTYLENIEKRFCKGEKERTAELRMMRRELLRTIGRYIIKENEKSREKFRENMELAEVETRKHIERLDRFIYEKNSELNSFQNECGGLVKKLHETHDMIVEQGVQIKDVIEESKRSVEEIKKECEKNSRAFVFVYNKLAIVTKIAETLAFEKYGILNEDFRELLTLYHEKKYGKGIMPFISDAIDKALEKAKKQENLH